MSLADTALTDNVVELRRIAVTMRAHVRRIEHDLTEHRRMAHILPGIVARSSDAEIDLAVESIVAARAGVAGSVGPNGATVSQTGIQGPPSPACNIPVGSTNHRRCGKLVSPLSEISARCALGHHGAASRGGAGCGWSSSCECVRCRCLLSVLATRRIMRLRAGARFEKELREELKALDATQRDRVQRALRLFVLDPRHPSLHFEKLRGHDRLYSIRFSRGDRIILRATVEPDLFEMHRIGPHDLYDRIR